MLFWLLQNALFASVLAPAVAMICRVFRPRPAVCHALWLLVLIKLVTPLLPLWDPPWLQQSEALEGRHSLAAGASPRAVAPKISESPGGATLRDIAEGDADAVPLAVVPGVSNAAEMAYLSVTSETLAPDEKPAGEAVSTGSFAPLATTTRTLLIVWAAGLLLALLRHGVRVVRLRRIVRNSATAPQSLVREVAVQSCKYRLKLPRVGICWGLPCPMVVGLPRAILLWPAELDERLDDGARQAVLAHELAHLKRRDHLTAWLEVAVACLWWWHPVVWWARRELREYAELACDAWVIAQLPAERSRYAKALVDVCEFISLAKTPTVPAVGMARGNRRSFERRLHMILRQRIAARTPLIAWLAIFAAALLVLPGFSTGQDGPVTTAVDAASSSKTESPTTSPTEATTTTKAAVTTEATATEAVADPSTTEHAPEAAPDAPATADDPAVAGINKAAKDAITDHQLSQMLPELQKWVREVRGQRKTIEPRVMTSMYRILDKLTKRMRERGATDETIVTEMYLQILGRRPNRAELGSWIQHLVVEDGSVERLVHALARSDEFTREPKHVVQNGTAMLPPTRVKQAKVKTLLRVVYDIPADKGEALAKFLKDNIKGEIEARVDQEGLVVTAEAAIQRTIASIVSLMTGEPVSLDVGDGPRVGTATIQVPVYEQFDDPSLGTTTYTAPTPVARAAPEGVYPPLPVYNRPSKSLRSTTKVPPSSVYKSVPTKEPASILDAEQKR